MEGDEVPDLDSPAVEVHSLRGIRRTTIVGDEDHGDAARPLRGDALEQQSHSVDVEARFRLVEKEEICALRETLREKRSLALPAGQLSKGSPFESGQTDGRDGCRGDGSILVSVPDQVPKRSTEPAPHPDDIRHGERQRVARFAALRHIGTPDVPTEAQLALLE